MNLSQRLAQISPGGSNGREVFHRARALIASGVAVADLTIGEHDIRTDPAILAAMDASARGGHTGYSSVAGIPALRAEIAGRIATRTGVATTPENIVVTAGGQAALFAAMFAIGAPGDACAFIDPYYVTYPGTIRSAGLVPRPIVTEARDGFLPRPEDLLAGTAGARGLLVNTPNNPTGAVYPDATLAGVADAARAHDLWLISDEVYDTQVWTDRHTSLRALPDMAAHTLVVGSLSKSHAMTGSRLGWICGPEEAVAHIVNLFVHLTYGIPGFVQDAGLFALQQGAPFEERIAAPFARRRALVDAALARTSAVIGLPTQGAMYAMLDVRATGLSGLAFAERLLEAERIAVMPGASFGAAASGHVRVAMTIDDAALADALARLVRFAEAEAAAARTTAMS
ncbi:pyridoxal phosphate-dependent aminotransferase [Roseisalinus antarcticus]|uniref:Aminotransferase n=1 Tax=Roseisalinus antarcticus TaxID=254357 RepID=A0A1Y5RC63_9RHOB|nr:aminotransferase class I/II-fold pyridoxal phosphate-dependent enzyme [Roseisalinus antarcticus]SLN14063.1 Arginine--pyruvate transaminase AruH [Roseisalinus antarcticus]